MERVGVVFALLAGSAFAQVSPEIEMMMGRQMAAKIDSSRGVIADAQVTGLVDRVLKTLSRAESLRFALTLTIVDNPDLVASALPGGHLVLSSGAILKADTEAELAALLAHAMGHVQARPYIDRTKATIPLMLIAGWWGFCGRSAVHGRRQVVCSRGSQLFKSPKQMCSRSNT